MRFAVCLVLLVACAKKETPPSSSEEKPALEGATMVSAGGGMVTSDDGKASLVIPAGALAADTAIKVTAITGRPEALGSARLIASYRFEPDGLTFAVPAVLDVPVSSAKAGTDLVVPLIVAVSLSDGVYSFNANPRLSIDLDTGAQVFSTELAHFSTVSLLGIEYPEKDDYFAITMEPQPPATAEVGTPYSVAMRFFQKRPSQQTFTFTYNDSSTNLAFSRGSGAVPVGSYTASTADPLDVRSEVGSYTCASLGAATYKAHIESALFHYALPNDSFALLQTECGADNDCDAGGLKANFDINVPPNARFFVDVKRTLNCTAPVIEPPDESDGPPYSGIVQYQGMDLTEAGVPPGDFRAVFYNGTDEQDAFDNYVAQVQRYYGIRADRLPNSTCQELTLATGAENVKVFGPLITPPSTQIGDAVKLDFPGMSYEAPYDAAKHLYVGSTSLQNSPVPPPGGVPVHVPAVSPNTQIVLQGWNKPAPTISMPLYEPETAADHVYTWDAGEMDGDFMHFVVELDCRDKHVAYECFTEPTAQVMNIASAQWVAMHDGCFNGLSDAYFWYARFFLVKRKQVSYLNKTLIGFTVREVHDIQQFGGE